MGRQEKRGRPEFYAPKGFPKLSETVKKFALFLICFFPAALLFFVLTFRFGSDGRLYWIFFNRVPIIVSGNGSSFQTAYQLKEGQPAYLSGKEIETIRDRYWVARGRSRADFYRQCYDTMAIASTNLNGHAYDIITFTLPTGTNTVYFDITNYRKKNRN